MTNVLVIKGHPLTEKESRTVTILNHFTAAYKAEHPSDEVTELDLFKTDLPEIDEDLLSGWDAMRAGETFEGLTSAQQQKIRRFDELTEQFLNSDKIVIANPLWNLMIPTKLKAWIDTIMVAGKTFKYTANGPVSMTEGKKALHIQSNGGTYEGNDPANQYLKGILDFVGIKDYSELFIEGIDYDPEIGPKVMADAKAKAEALAKTF